MERGRQESSEAPFESSEDREFLLEQVRQLYRNASVGLIATAINSVVLAFVLRDVVSPVRLISWLAAVYLITIPRYVQCRRFRRADVSPADAGRWRNVFIAGMALSGLAWGAAGVFLFPAQSAAHQTFLVFVLGGMAAGAAAAYSIVFPAFLAFTLSALIPIIVRFLAEGDEVHTAMAGMTLLFAAMMVIVGRHVGRATQLSLRLRFKNSALVDSLTQSVEETELLNKELIEHRAHLSELVEARTAELSRVNERLRREVEERKKAEAAVAQTADYYQSLIENTLDIITVLDAEGTILYESPSISRVLGYGAKELVGRSAFELLHPDDVTAAREALGRVRARPGRVEYIEVRLRHTSGSWRMFEIAGKAVAGASGALDVVVNSRDITERRKMEAHLRRAQKLESLGEFAGGLAHDLNNVLTGILGNVDVVAMGLRPEDEACARLEAAKAAAYQARDLSNQLLTFAKGGEPVKKTISLRGLVENATRLALHGSPATYDIDVPDGLWPVDADEGQLAQAVGNVVLNARQAMPDGGLVRVRCENVRDGLADAVGLERRRYIRLTVRDSGVGISKERQERIFDPYFTTKAAGGLGLAIAYSIIKRHGGAVSVESEPGRGTAVIIYLPASDKALAPLEAAGIPTASTGRVLVMDDEAIVRDVAAAILGKLGYEVTAAKEGKEAVAAFRQAKDAGRPFTVVIMDLTVPGGMGGKDAVREILALDPGARVIVSSGYSEDPILARYEDYGFAASVSKPFSVRSLADAVYRLAAKPE